jgi:hypothetical protein
MYGNFCGELFCLTERNVCKFVKEGGFNLMMLKSPRKKLTRNQGRKFEYTVVEFVLDVGDDERKKEVGLK